MNVAEIHLGGPAARDLYSVMTLQETEVSAPTLKRREVLDNECILVAPELSSHIQIRDGEFVLVMLWN